MVSRFQHSNPNSLKMLTRHSFGKAFLSRAGVLAFYLLASPSVAGVPRDLTESEKLVVQRAVSAGLKDPTSPLFLWPRHSGDPVLYCGLVNAKNSYGGYVGYTPYMVFLISEGGPPKAVLHKVGDGDLNSPRTLSIAQTCWDRGYDFATAKPSP